MSTETFAGKNRTLVSALESAARGGGVSYFAVAALRPGSSLFVPSADVPERLALPLPRPVAAMAFAKLLNRGSLTLPCLGSAPDGTVGALLDRLCRPTPIPLPVLAEAFAGVDPRPLSTLLAEEIFTPCGLRSARVRNDRLELAADELPALARLLLTPPPAVPPRLWDVMVTGLPGVSGDGPHPVGWLGAGERPGTVMWGQHVPDGASLLCVLDCEAPAAATAVLGSSTPAAFEEIRATIGVLASAPSAPLPRTGLDQLTEYLDLVRSQRVGVVVNHTSRDRYGTPLVDLLPTLGAKLQVIFTPEHGLFGTEEAGKRIESGSYRGTPVVSLYGSKKKPAPADLRDVDLLLYDIQDVAARFYTYISTMAMAMEAAAEAAIPFFVLDRPCLRGGTEVSGPLLEDSCRSFVGYLPLPIAYGMTCGELAGMIAGERWLDAGAPPLHVLPVDGWQRGAVPVDRRTFVPPSPNLPTLQSVTAYPGTCFFEATNVSEGRGTNAPFLTIGAPWIDGVRLADRLNAREDLPGVYFVPFRFTPSPRPGKALRPKFSGEACQGVYVLLTNATRLRPAGFRSVRTGLRMIAAVQRLWPEKLTVRESFFRLLSGREDLHVRLLAGEDPGRLLDAGAEDLEDFRRRRERYLLYR